MPTADSSSSPTVDDALAAVRRELRHRHAAYLHTLRGDALAPLRTTLGALREAHAAARAPLAALGDEPARRDLWEAVRGYRRAAMETVWRPLRTRLSDVAPGTRLREAGAALDDGGETLADAVPDTIERPEPEGLYVPDATDAWGRRLGKALVRVGRGLRGLVETPGPRTQRVPMAALVRREAATTLAAARDRAVDAGEQAIVGWAARLERTADAWTHRVLEAERVLDCPSFHARETDAAPPAPEDDPTSGVMEADVGALRTAVAEQAEALDETLRAGQALSLHAVAERLEAARADALARLRSAAARAGSVMAAPRSARPSRARRVAGEERRTRSERWPDWFDELTQRLEALDTLSTVRDALVERHRALVADALEVGLAPTRTALRDALDRLRALREEVDALLGPPDADDPLDLLQAFDHAAEEGIDRIEQYLLVPLREHTPRRALQDVQATHRAAVEALIEEQPEAFVVHPLPDPTADRVAPAPAHRLTWTQECQAVLDELLFDAWAAALDPIAAATDAASERAAEVRAVVEFNLDAALQELQDLRAARRAGDPDDAYVDNARELALGGLDRALDLLGTAADTLEAGAAPMLRDTWRATATTWTDLHDRLRATGQTRVHVLRLRGELVRGARWLAGAAGRQARGATTQVRRALHRAQRQAQRLVRLGQAAVGTTPVDEAALREAIDALSTVDAVLAELPLVYRRLFSFRSLHDPALLVGREDDRAAVERHAERWQAGLTNALVLTGPAGSGRTSLLNVLRKTTFRDAQWHTLDLTERVSSEAAFARQVATALGLPLERTGPLTLDDVAEHLREQPVPSRRRVCVVEQLEHAFHRTVGGTALGARILGFFSETDTRVLWLATTTDTAWQFVEASEPTAARLVVRHRLDPLDRDELEALVMARHRRSGLPLTFEVPDEAAAPILTRRVRAAGSEEQRQALLRADFFDRLHDACGQNVILALFYWFRAAHLDPDAATLRVRPLAPVSFDVLDTLPLPHAFALKALLDHGTLTADELAEVLGVSPSTGRALLETLGNALVIAPAHRVEGPGVFQFASVDRETRYRVRPLLVQPVVRFLRSRNIVH
jgi:hypothetical protein